MSHHGSRSQDKEAFWRSQLSDALKPKDITRRREILPDVIAKMEELRKEVRGFKTTLNKSCG